MANRRSVAGVVLRVWVTPRAARERIGRLADGGFRAFVTSPRENGTANTELIAMLAKRLRVPQDWVEIVSGTSHQRKLVRVAGCSKAEVDQRIPPLPSGHYLDAAARRQRARRMMAKRKVRAAGRARRT